ncbi:major facilitator superfamily domain-containing protein [Rhodocollybia butyracea]|uniref:Major facilitator superfamily domain-containing protein n=1 Tax=Rhodocollybia butyracea TaxID=206335 RepID=A0A9P5PBD5_9AGAR|nr:major facilitator superfamily domain-containing protein [Rhodocollybia butyracea]
MSYSPDTSSIELEQIPAYPPASLDQDLPRGPYEISFSVSHNIGENEYGIDFSGASSVPLSATSTRGLNIEPENAISLPPMDGGFHAFAYLASAWFIEFLVWSPPFSYGVFLNFYTTDPDLKQYSSSSLALVGSMASGVLYLSSPVVLPIINRFPRHKRTVMILGILLCVSGLIGAAFSTKIWHLIITQGFMYSLGGSLLYFPTTTYLFEWFSQKRGIANGVMYSGTGVGGVVTPFVIENLLSKYGRRTTLLSLAFAFLFLSVPCLPFNKPRVPVAQVVDIRSVNTGFLKYSPFWILFMANLSQGLASFLPSLYLPSDYISCFPFASDLSLGTTSGTLALSFINGASVPGLIFLGWLSDLLDVRWSILLSSLGSALAVFLLWASQRPFSPSLSTVDGDDPRQASILMSILFAGRGIGNVLAAPIASGLLHPWNLTNKSRTNYGFEGYGPLIIFTGLTLLVSSMGTGYRILERRPISSLVGE